MNVLLTIVSFFAVLNLMGFASMGIDKLKAKRHAWRIPEATLFLICIVGGSIGSTLGMFVFHHKTKHWYFRFGFPLIMACHIILAAYLIGSGTISIM